MVIGHRQQIIELQDKEMVYRSLKLGVLFSNGIFAIKIGVGIPYVVARQLRRRAKVAVVLLFAMAYSLVYGPAAADSECPPYIWIACGKQNRLSDGSVTQRYHLRNGGAAGPDCDRSPDWQAFYRLGDRTSTGKGYYRAPILCADGDRYLEINCRTNARLELVVVGTCGGKQFMAQTLHPLFGKASPDKPQARAPVDELPPDLPRLHLQPSRHNYYMQTGNAYRFSYAGQDTAVARVSILEDPKRLPELIPMAPGGGFVYTPPHDPMLDRTGPYDFKETIVLIEEAAAGTDYATTFTLLLHRSYSAHLRRLPGVILLGITAAATLALAIVYRRRPWYR